MGLFNRKKKKQTLMSGQASSTSSFSSIDFSYQEKMKAALKTAPEKVLMQLVGSGFSAVTGVPLLSSLLNLKNVKVSHKKIKQLKTLVFEDCSCGNCDSILNYALAQKSKKLKRDAKGSIPVVAYSETARKIIHHFMKANQGMERMAVAKTLWCFASIDNAYQYSKLAQPKESCEMAIKIISVLVFADETDASYFKTLGLVSDKKGILLIAAGLKSA